MFSVIGQYEVSVSSEYLFAPDGKGLHNFVKSALILLLTISKTVRNEMSALLPE